MNEIEQHPFKIFFEDNFTSIVIGTFPCLNFESHTKEAKYGDWYYSGSNKNMFWDILSNIYSVPLEGQEAKKNILRQNGIGMADIANSIQRKKNSCKDADFNLIEYNSELMEKINQHPEINLLFTSQIAFNHTVNGFLIRYGKSLPHSPAILLSPSPMASIPISKREDYKSYFSQDPSRNTKTFRIEKYKEHFIPIL